MTPSALEQLIEAYRDVVYSRGSAPDADLVKEARAEQAELIEALRRSLKEVDDLWRSEVQGRNSPEHCPYDSYAAGMALLARFAEKG